MDNRDELARFRIMATLSMEHDEVTNMSDQQPIPRWSSLYPLNLLHDLILLIAYQIWLFSFGPSSPHARSFTPPTFPLVPATQYIKRFAIFQVPTQRARPPDRDPAATRLRCILLAAKLHVATQLSDPNTILPIEFDMSKYSEVDMCTLFPPGPPCSSRCFSPLEKPCLSRRKAIPGTVWIL